jgi:hypothetical protein
LIGSQASSGDLDALHLHAFLALSVRPEMQTLLLHFCLIKFAGPVSLNLLLVMVQLVGDMLRQRSIVPN